MEHTDPSIKDKLLGTIGYLEAKNIPYYKSEVFRHFNITKTTGWRILQDARTYGPDGHRKFRQVETRGRRRVLTPQRLAAIERLIESEGFNVQPIPWAGIPEAAGLDVAASGETVRRAVKTLDSRVCTACESRWVSAKLASMREEYCRSALEARPRAEDWRGFRFTSEVHFGYGPEGKVWVCQRPWERACPSCLMERQLPEKPEMDLKKKTLHGWGAVGYDGFRDGLHWYDVPPNAGGKMRQQLYYDAILQPIVGKWLRRGDRFILEEENDISWGLKKPNLVTAWKETHKIMNVFNCHESPDLVGSPIERALQLPKAYVQRQPHSADATLKAAAQEGFDAIDAETVNGWIDEIPEILKACIANQGRIAPYPF